MVLRGLRKIIRVICAIRVQKPYASRININFRVPPNKIRVIREIRVQELCITRINKNQIIIRVIREIRVQELSITH